MQRHHPLTLSDRIRMPSVDEDPSETVELSGFLHLVNLFKPFDEVFVGLWNKTRRDCSTAWLAQLQKQLANALPTHLESTEGQAADLRTSQQWLRTMVWQLSVTNGYLSSKSTDSSMTFTYPVEIARDLVTVTEQLSRPSMEVHGIGLVRGGITEFRNRVVRLMTNNTQIEKLFDVACTLADVMACIPLETGTIEIGPHDYLNHLLNTISTLRGGTSRYLPLLLAKVKDVMSTMTGPIIPLLLVDEARQDELEEMPEGGESALTSRPSFVPPSLTTASSDMSVLSTTTLGEPPSALMAPSTVMFDKSVLVSHQPLEYL